ncbi:hypothetical protein JYT85_00990 [Desulfocapsa sp. AH-315-G09]|uniref:Uncharacterized protein n=1 Tax=Desulfotalea psychrophila TaxID=84980 RepID=A0ABS3ATT2_9BACT|nr:hypothetical protein [Desulfocapsa sp. AH-315-J15]MBN4065208.1 hypothetical protein [Desulfocapsa sp. AH-315-G09]MBN4068022.1 hypothetical protein [Desulfotalea psychrophila]
MFSDKEAMEKMIEEILLFIRYAVPEEEQVSARDYLELFHEDQFALTVIKEYYRNLPDAREESLLKISVIEQKEQVFLLLLSTANHHYLYLTNDEEGTFLGEYEKGVVDSHILSFFDYPDQKAFSKAHSSTEGYREYLPLERMNERICPSCGTKAGDMHTLGCPVELCPWCGGQLNHCNCRFEQLGVEELTDETKLEKLEEKLEKKGRIAYATEQRPSFLKE